MNKVKIYGGLGNQIFQYALCLALNHNGLKTRISFSNFLFENHHNGFNLGKAFNLKLPFPLNILNFCISNCRIIFSNKYIAHINKVIINFYHKKRYKTYHELEEFVYDSDVFKQHSCLFVGIWQVLAYFKDIEYIIRENLVFKIPVDKKNNQLINDISSYNSVSIHIRRGDFLSYNWAVSHEVIKDTTYYVNSIDYINKKIENPRFYVFSDDIAWVKENFNFVNYTIVENNKGSNSYIDMYLMSLCKHNIIANSTFSWWAAWLNKNKNKIVIAPDRWLNNKNCESIYPSHWIRIKV